MYLKSLEIFGFKSFAPKTLLEFHRGVTCVVGPNGCGKSNVLDAVRWVLGEQSAKALRGGEMADVIFSGTDSRAAVGMAEVSMSFSECEEALGLDWHEVTITRRVFRDGGSEYLLNKTPCRLKDIHQLFMDTGIGRSAYSIMEQGKIDAILSSRPEDRRAIFEEAAGITKYKTQKKEALRKLEATEANLLRLADIIKEVKRQIGSLQRQAGKARRYQALLADLRMLETHAAQRQFAEFENARVEAAAEHGRLAERQTEAAAEIERQESEVGLQRIALEEMEQRLQAARQVVSELKTRIASGEQRLVFNEERGREFSGLIERYRTDVAGAEEKLRIAQTQLHDTDTQLEEITTLLAGELRRMEAKQFATGALTKQRQDAERLIATLASEAARGENKINVSRGQIASVMQQRDGAEARLSILAGELEQMSFAFTQFAERLDLTQTELTGALAEQENVAGRVTSAEADLRERQTGLAGIERELRETQRALAEKESKLEVLRALNAGGEGFSEGTQAVLRGLDNPEFFKPAVLGALTQFMEVPAEFVTAVEAALGANLQAIVMKDALVAESVLKTLSAKKLGKATLALREFFQPNKPEESVLPDGAIGWLREQVNAQPEAAELLDGLLKRAVLVADLETALRLFPTCGLPMVTRAGEVLTADGLLHGGVSTKAVNSVLQRKNEISALAKEAAGIRAQAAEIEARRGDLQAALEAAQAQLEEAREARQGAALRVSTLRNQLAMNEREAKDAERKQQTLEGERASSAARQNEAAQRLGALEADLASSQAQLEGLQNKRAEAAAALEVVRGEESEVAGELNELKIKVATERQRHSSLHHQRQPMEARLRELEVLIGQRQQDIASYEERAATMLSESAEITANLARLGGEVSENESVLTALTAERAGLAGAVEELGNTLRILRHQLTECHDQRSRLEVRQSQLEMRSAAVHEHIQKRYQIDLREFERDLHGLRVAIREHAKRAQRSAESAPEDPIAAAPQADVDDAFAIDWERLDAMVKEADQRLDGMGPVNIDAIQEYDELEQRFTFLEQQNSDLEKAKAELMGVITKINQTTRTLFADTFEKIRVNFGEMFVELFGGGKANLVLSDESDPLESGIEIIAKPPGKQLTSITLLSGGEKTMTAVALLFSIYMVKPSPFCVLDEMDAPLDESNINRFIKILDRFVGQSQFVVISHNKRTIARADAIYGVTMEEHGVSKLVGVKFSKREDSGEQQDVLGNNNPQPVPTVAEAFGKSPNLASEDALAPAGAA